MALQNGGICYGALDNNDHTDTGEWMWPNDFSPEPDPATGHPDDMTRPAPRGRTSHPLSHVPRPLATHYPLYTRVRVKFAIALAFAAAWCVFSTWLALPWIAELSALTGPAAAWIVIAGIALVPGFGNAFLVAGIVLDRRPRFAWSVSVPPVTILIAAYNEADAIEETLQSIFRQRFDAPIEIIVIDDGSTDGTSLAVERMRRSPERPASITVELLTQPANGGKATALNAGLTRARHDIVVTTDADTWVFRDGLRSLVANHVSSPGNTAATAGTVLVRNSRTNLITRLQEWDYFQGISVVKRIQSLFQGTLVAQGAFSAYDRAALEEIGGWEQTVGEDIVLTWALIERGYRVGYSERAFAFTNVPETLRAYMRQRKRWSRGLIEAFKRSPAVFVRPRLNLPFIYLNALFPYLDLIYVTVFVPGVIAAVFFGFYAIAGLMTLVLIPLTLAIATLMFIRQRRIFRIAGLRVRHNFVGFVGYLVAYQLILAPASLVGYFTELCNRRKSW